MTKDPTIIESAIERLAQGGVVVVVDALERENEGDFLAAAELVTPETIHFMISYGRGHLCQPINSTTAQRLDLQPLVPSNGLELPRFAMPIDAVDCSTGISPVDRAQTMRMIADKTSRTDDFVRPGHIFPLIAQDGGVLKRPGHTEAAIDLTRLAGLAPSGVLCEICSDDGRNMANLKELNRLAAEFDLPIITIDGLIDYRLEHIEDFETIEMAASIVSSRR